MFIRGVTAPSSFFVSSSRKRAGSEERPGTGESHAGEDPPEHLMPGCCSTPRSSDWSTQASRLVSEGRLKERTGEPSKFHLLGFFLPSSLSRSHSQFLSATCVCRTDYSSVRVGGSNLAVIVSAEVVQTPASCRPAEDVDEGARTMNTTSKRTQFNEPPKVVAVASTQL